MCQVTKACTLTSNQQGAISWCSCCNTYSLLFGTSSLSFTYEEFTQFLDLLSSLRAHQFDYLGNRVLIRSNQHAVGLVLTEEEVKNLKSMMLEVMAMEKEIEELVS